MKAKRHLRARIAAALAISVIAVLSSPAIASPPAAPPVDPSVSTVPGSLDGTTPTGDVTRTDGQTPPQIIQSWALTPAGSVNGNEGGTRSELAYEANPGTVINDAVILFNYSNVQMDFRVYATDAFNNDDGQFDLLPSAEAPVDAGSWVSIVQENISLPPGKQVTVPITITVPIDASPGDHAAAVVASSTALGGNANQIVNVERRTGTRMYIQVAGLLTPDLVVTRLTSAYQTALNPLSGSSDVSFRVENRGNARMTGTLAVKVAGPFGLGERTLALPQLTELLPGQHADFAVTVDDVPALMLSTVTVTLQPEGIKGRVGEAITAMTVDDASFAPPITLLVVLMVVLFGLLAFRAYRRYSTAAAGSGASYDDEPQPEREHEPA